MITLSSSTKKGNPEGLPKAILSVGDADPLPVVSHGVVQQSIGPLQDVAHDGTRVWILEKELDHEWVANWVEN